MYFFYKAFTEKLKLHFIKYMAWFFKSVTEQLQQNVKIIYFFYMSKDTVKRKQRNFYIKKKLIRFNKK